MHTRRGIFGAAGNGDGIFATTVAGLGADPFVNVPASCWEKAGFKDCSAAANQATNDDLYKIQASEPSFQPGTPAWDDQFDKIWAIYLQACAKKHGCSTGATGAPTTKSATPPVMTLSPEDAFMQPQSSSNKWIAIAAGAAVALGIGYYVMKKRGRA